MENEKQNKPKRSYFELCEALQKAAYGKECRALHKEFKKYGSGLPLFMRYPSFPLIISIISLVLVLGIPVLTCILQ